MSTSLLTPDSTTTTPKPRRVLACVLCQQRKVKCERKFPCKSCIKARVQCVPATLAPRRRRRRFPERELLERLRKYEDLLHQNNIKFDPLHEQTGEKPSPSADGHYDSEEEQQDAGGTYLPSPSRSVKSEKVHEFKYVRCLIVILKITNSPRNFWHAMNLGVRTPYAQIRGLLTIVTASRRRRRQQFLG
jgi:hypothetical protein